MAHNASRFSRRYWLRLITFTAVVGTIAGLAGLAYLVWLQLHVFVTPLKISDVGVPTPDIPAPFEEITLTTSDGMRIAGWYIPGRRPEAIILVHGINANRRDVLPEAAILAEAGYHLALIDLRGHGRSGESLKSYGYREALDVVAAVDFLAANPEIKQIGALGVSYGGAAVARAAALDPRLLAVVIQNSYSSLPAAVDDAFEQMSIFPKWPFAPLLVALAQRRVGIDITQVNSARDLATLSPRAVMIVHGSEDRLFPRHHAEAMFAAAGEPKELWLIDGMDHGNPATAHADEYRARVPAFFARAFAE